MNKMTRVIGGAVSAAALVWFVTGSIGCDQKETSSPQRQVQPDGAAGNAGHDHAGHDHAGHDHAASDDTAAGDPAKPAQKLCPVTGKEINASAFTVHEGRKVFFCCERCIPKFKEEPAQYLAKLDGGT